MAPSSRATAALTLRPATMDDADRTFTWANDPDTRAASFDTAEIPRPRHVAWLREQLERSDRHPFVAELGGEPVAFVRLDRAPDTERECVVSLNVAPAARGRGVGARAIAAAVAEARRLGFSAVRAHVRSENEASVRAFSRAGFEELTRDARALRLVARTGLRG